MNSLSRKLRDVMYDRGLSIAETARVCGLAPEHMWVVATGVKIKHGPSVVTLNKLETGLGLKRGTLFAAVCEGLDEDVAKDEAAR